MLELEPEYYRVKTFAPKAWGREWLVWAWIIRKDTDETVLRLKERDAAVSAAERRLMQRVQEQLIALGPPSDWGRDAAPAALVRAYCAEREEMYNETDQLAKDTPSEAAYKVRWDEILPKLKFRFAQKFAQRLATMSERQLISLFTLTPREAELFTDPYVMDELEAKHALYRLIDNPSTSIRQAYEEMQRRQRELGDVKWGHEME